MAEEPAAPQSILNEVVSQDAAERKQQQEQIEKKRFTIPKITVDSFFKNKSLKKRVKLAIGVYIVIVFSLLLSNFYASWKKNDDYQDTYKNRQTNYLDTLSSINLATLSEDRSKLFSGFQITKDPVYALYVLEAIANESGVLISNPAYSISSIQSKDGPNIRLACRLQGTREQISAFLSAIHSTKPLLSLANFSVSSSKGAEKTDVLYQAHIVLTMAVVPTLGGEESTLQKKLDENVELPYPVKGLSDALKTLENLRVLTLPGLGQTQFGKTNLFIKG